MPAMITEAQMAVVPDDTNHGTSGKKAPRANITNDDPAAWNGLPS